MGPVGAPRPHPRRRCSSPRSSAGPATPRRCPTPRSWPTCAPATSRASRSTTPTASISGELDGRRSSSAPPARSTAGSPTPTSTVLREQGRRGRLQDPAAQLPREPAAVPDPCRDLRRLLLVHAAPGPGPDGRHHVHRPLEGQDLLHRATRHDLRRRRRLRGRQAGDHRGRRLPQDPERFAEIGARIPKGVLLVGPPAPARPSSPGRSPARPACRSCRSPARTSWRCSSASAPAGSATCSRRARKLGRAIIFVDEIDSIGRKRGAGLGGGHDEREQTLNQMLSEMDGFEATEGIVMMAATNRPDILDPALLRPGRFDRQVVVPLPELERARADPAGARQVQAHGPRRRPRPSSPGARPA